MVWLSKQDLLEPGKCLKHVTIFEKLCQCIISQDQLRLCQGPVGGKLHCWIETTDKKHVIDLGRPGKKRVFCLSAYYADMHVEADTVKRYDLEEMNAQINKYHRKGFPTGITFWGFDTSAYKANQTP